MNKNSEVKKPTQYKIMELKMECLSQTADDSFDFEDPGCEVDLTELEEACVSLRWSQTADDSFD